MSSSSSWSLSVGCLVGEVLDGLGPESLGGGEDLIGDGALPPEVLLADDALIGELDFKGDELPLPLGGDEALGGEAGLGDGKAGLMNSANSL